MKWIIGMVLALGLAGCSAMGSVTPNTTAYVGANAFDAVEVTATKYLRLPVCGTGPVICRTHAASKVVITQVKAGRVVRNNLEAVALAGDSVSAMALSASLQMKVDAINAQIKGVVK